MTVLAIDDSVQIPPLTRGWRMRMALEHADITREQMAAVLGVDPSTVSRWMHDAGKRQPRRPDMETWARMCRVPVEWLAPTDGEELPAQPTVPSVPRGFDLYRGESDTLPRRRLLSVVPVLADPDDLGAR